MSGMNSERLSARQRQPGHDRTFMTSEANFIAVARECLDEKRYIVAEQPDDLKRCFAEEGETRLGIKPEAKVESRATGRKFFVEVKKQGPAGNAHERAAKHHTMGFADRLHALYGYDYHPYVTIFCESLATLDRYTRQHRFLYRPDEYFLWVDYDPQLLCDFLRARCAAWLDG